MGKAAIREYRFSRHNAFPDGEGKEEAASPQKRKPTPPRCARLPFPREGASMDTPSFQRKGGRMPPHRLPTKKAYDTRMPFSPYCHFERKREIPCSQRIGRTVFHADSITKENGNGKRKRSLGCARDDETRKRLFPFLFNLLRKPTPASLRSAVPSKERGSRGHSCTCQQKLDTKLKKLGIKIEYLYKIQ